MKKRIQLNHYKVFLCLMIGIFFLSACSMLDKRQAENHYKEGLNYHFIERNYQKAIAEFDQAIELESEYVDAIYYRGRSYLFLNELEKAIADFPLAIEIDPTYVDAYERRADSYAIQEDETLINFAIEDYATVIQLDPQNAYAYGQRGRLYFQTGQLELALSDVNKSIELETDSIELASHLFSRSRIYYEMDEFDKAIADLDQAAEADPSSALAIESVRQNILDSIAAEE